MRGTDGTWRSLKITSRTSTTVVVAELIGEPFINLDPMFEWRLGDWSDTTGYPVCGLFYQDRLWAFGSDQFPDMYAASNSQNYEVMAPTEPDGEVLDTNSIRGRLNSRSMARIKWAEDSDKGILVGSGSREFVISAVEGAGKTITPDSNRAVRASARGSSDMEPVLIDNAALYGQRSGRTIREFAYVYDVDNFKSPSMSLLASHIGEFPFVQMAYAAEPYSIVWMRRLDGSVVGLTYNRDEDVVAWHTHDFSGGFVESIAVMPSLDKTQDTLWMVVRRVINGVSVKYIEKLSRFWDYGMTVDNAQFVDSALRYSGSAIEEVYGLPHLEGEVLYGIADGYIVGPLTVTDGKVTLPRSATDIVLGLGYASEGETMDYENGAEDGTAQGKKRQITEVKAKVWKSYGGQFGTWNDETDEAVYDDTVYKNNSGDVIEKVELFTGTVEPVTLQPGFTKRGSVFIRRPADQPTPFNVVALMPRLSTQPGA